MIVLKRFKTTSVENNAVVSARLVRIFCALKNETIQAGAVVFDCQKSLYFTCLSTLSSVSPVY